VYNQLASIITGATQRPTDTHTYMPFAKTCYSAFCRPKSIH